MTELVAPVGQRGGHLVGMDGGALGSGKRTVPGRLGQRCGAGRLAEPRELARQRLGRPPVGGDVMVSDEEPPGAGFSLRRSHSGDGPVFEIERLRRLFLRSRSSAAPARVRAEAEVDPLNRRQPG